MMIISHLSARARRQAAGELIGRLIKLLSEWLNGNEFPAAREPKETR